MILKNAVDERQTLEINNNKFNQIKNFLHCTANNSASNLVKLGSLRKNMGDRMVINCFLAYAGGEI